MDTEDSLDLAPVLRLWGLPNPAGVERLGGSNNTSWRVEISGGSFVLRLYRNTGNLPHVEYEHALLQQLAAVPLSFLVPIPLPSRHGRTLEPVGMDGRLVSASLFAVIPGEHPREWRDRHRVRHAGMALGELDRALAGVDMSRRMPTFPTYGDLDRIHGAVPHPEAVVAELPIAEQLKSEFIAFLRRARESVGRLYSALPGQIIHSDFGGSNLLFEHDRVSGVLDFEFAAPDLRAMDLMIAAGMIGPIAEQDVPDLDVLRNLAGGYGEMMRLTVAEIEAAPDLLRLRGAVTIIHRAGRWKAGISPAVSVESRIVHHLALERWVERNRDALIEALSGAAEGRSGPSQAAAERGHGRLQDVVLDHQPEQS